MKHQVIDSLPSLDALFGVVGDASLRKEVSCLHLTYQAMIKASPFLVLATAGPNGLDVSPRGDPSGFVSIYDEKTLYLPERRGNNRIDSLRNIVSDPRVALLFLIPGRGETLRVNGTARILVSPDLLKQFEVQGAVPKCVIEVRVEAVFFQCARAIQRSNLWQALSAEILSTVPSPGSVLQALTDSSLDGKQYDLELPARQRSSLY